MSQENARAIVRDGGAEKGATLTEWVDALAEASQGWPQHIISAAGIATRFLQQPRAEMSRASLKKVLDVVRRDRTDYYELRINGIKMRFLTKIANLVAQIPSDGMIREDRIETILEDGEAFNLLVHKGVLPEVQSKWYRIPIPSMHNFLVETFGPERRTAPPNISTEW